MTNTMEKSNGIRKGAWSREEDILLKNCVEMHGEGKWHLVPPRTGLNRCRKSCRLRWLNYLRPNLNRESFLTDEIDLIIRLHKLLGNRWSLIAGRLPGRTGNDVKNLWNSKIKKISGVGRLGKEELTETVPNQNRITKSNIIRPRPRTVSQATVSDWFRKELMANEEHETDRHGYCEPSSSLGSSPSYKTDDRIRWWTNLLVTADEGGEGSAKVPEDPKGSTELPDELKSDNGWLDFSFNEDVWKLLNLSDNNTDDM